MTFTIENVDWMSAKDKLTRLREKVFVYEWRIPKDVEFDRLDNEANHVLLCDDAGREVATARITPQGEIGRIAVISSYRKPEVYQQLFSALLAVAKQQGLETVSVQCELEGVSYYQQQGFRPVGAVYMDAGIARQKMTCSINAFSLPKVEFTH
ncbi:GNAT family N-acetyltransferase [Aliiglaciecola sp. CAU 1673]|uniref:GNAT family N-acetyltransferase n=1 Tax=Aliiglaciecola sp. CAU 1673 TaxID=3032595 RepID=UPI0023DB0C17|nr:GNAT family N-acetyltransferase [Aliiglaciecola sp. CAU 1673]MDF2177725.1 GNAT family N-acetyltransferase [Aliiglaciecola sp. CAU 1673]